MTQPNPNVSESFWELPDDEVVRLLVDQLHVNENNARYMLAIHRGQITGEVIFPEGQGDE